MKKTVLVITGTRAEYGLLRPVMREIQKSKKLELRVLATGMHMLHSRGHTVDEIQADTFPLTCTVPIDEGDTMLESLSKEIKGISDYCTHERPDMIVVLGDRDESFAGAIVGGHLKIPVVHLHGGDKTGTIVDEYIRHATTKFAHLHCPATKKSARRVRLLGEESWRIAMTGGSGLDELRSLETLSKQALAKKYNLDADQEWYFVLQHPTPFDDVPPVQQIKPLLEVMKNVAGEKIIISPNTDTHSDIFLNEIARYQNEKGFRFFKHVTRVDLIGMLKNSRLLIGNSSMGIIDASYLRTPTINIGNRQASREQGNNVVNCGYDQKSIENAINKVISPAFARKIAKSKSPYGDGHAAERIVRHIEKNIDRKDLFHKKLTHV